jgi:hypothetical protein
MAEPSTPAPAAAPAAGGQQFNFKQAIAQMVVPGA